MHYNYVWTEIEKLKKRIQKLESKSDTYDVIFEIRTLGEMDELIKIVREELEKYSKVIVSVEKHD